MPTVAWTKNDGISSDKYLQELANKFNIHIDGIIDFRDIKAPVVMRNGEFQAEVI